MPKIVVVNQAGVETEVDAAEGCTLMEVIRDNGFGEMLALCGGCCSCATCHVHIEADYFGKLAAVSEDENDLLDSSDRRSEFSRLSCQVPVTAAMEGMRVAIAQED